MQAQHSVTLQQFLRQFAFGDPEQEGLLVHSTGSYVSPGVLADMS